MTIPMLYPLKVNPEALERSSEGDQRLMVSTMEASTQPWPMPTRKRVAQSACGMMGEEGNNQNQGFCHLPPSSHL